MPEQHSRTTRSGRLTLPGLATVLFTLLLSACSLGISTPPSPTPEQEEITRQDASNLAQFYCNIGSLEAQSAPTEINVHYTTLGEAFTALGRGPDADRPPSLPVWLVSMQGEWTLESPPQVEGQPGRSHSVSSCTTVLDAASGDWLLITSKIPTLLAD